MSFALAYMGEQRMPSKQMRFQPTLNRMVVIPDEAPTMTPGGILLPQNAQTHGKSRQGVVVAAGNGRLTDYGAFLTAPAKVGDVVLFNLWAGTEWTDTETNTTYLILNDHDILCVYPTEEQANAV